MVTASHVWMRGGQGGGGGESCVMTERRRGMDCMCAADRREIMWVFRVHDVKEAPVCCMASVVKADLMQYSPAN